LKRKDDDAETVKIRIGKYKEKTLPSVGHLKKEGIKVKEVAGKQTPAELHNDILKALE
jgi:adenylate kinase family enzyme